MSPSFPTFQRLAIVSGLVIALCLALSLASHNFYPLMMTSIALLNLFTSRRSVRKTIQRHLRTGLPAPLPSGELGLNLMACVVAILIAHVLMPDANLWLLPPELMLSVLLGQRWYRHEYQYFRAHAYH